MPKRRGGDVRMKYNTSSGINFKNKKKEKENNHIFHNKNKIYKISRKISKTDLLVNF